MNKKIKEWAKELKKHRYHILISLVFLAITLIINYFAGIYVNKMGLVIASDLILDHIPTVDLTFLYIFGYAIFIAVFFIYTIVFEIKRFDFVISQFSFLVLLRSFFISLTHLKAPAEAIAVNLPHIFNLLVFTNDLFFSGHTAIPFLGYLLFRKKKIGIFFLIATIVFASTVLLMHVHYSIDVFAAFFITYGSYKFGCWVFRNIEGKKEIVYE